MIKDMIVRNLSPAIQRSHLAALSNFARSPDRFVEDVWLSRVKPKAHETYEIYAVDKKL